MGEWRETTLGEVAEEVTVGFVGSMAHEYRDHGIPFLRSQNVKAHSVDLQGVKYIDFDFDERLRKSRLKAGDVVTVRTGLPGVSALIPPELDGANCADLVITRPGKDLDGRWLSYYINGAAQHFISSHLVGAVQQHFNVGAAKRLALRLPGLAEQRAIAEVLGALDDKIAANGRVVHTVDALASASYRSMLSEGSEEPLTSLAEFVNGKAFTKGASGTGRVVIRIAELNSGIGGSTVYSDAEVDDRHVARPGDILFAWSGSLTLHRWFRPEGIVNQHIFKVIPKSAVPKWLVWHAVADRLDYFKAVAADKATTMGHIQRRHLDEMVTVPAQEKVASHDGSMTALWDRALAAEKESLRLVATRDALLPGLMSGVLRVKDAERLAEDVT